MFFVSFDLQEFYILRLSLRITKDSHSAKVIPREGQHTQTHTNSFTGKTAGSDKPLPLGN